MLKRHRTRAAPRQAGRDVPGSGAAVYEIDGRLLIRTIDGSDGLGIERDDVDVIDGYDDTEADILGRAIVAAVDRAGEVPRPATWRSRSDYAAPLLAASPRRYRSYRAWQRAARHVSVDCGPDGWQISRLYPDLDHGGWQPADVDDDAHSRSARRRLPADAMPSDVGTAVLDCLQEPPLSV